MRRCIVSCLSSGRVGEFGGGEGGGMVASLGVSSTTVVEYGRIELCKDQIMTGLKRYG